MQGVVVKNTGSWYTVKSTDGSIVECKIKGSFRTKEIRSTNPLAVGDSVFFDVSNDGSAIIYDMQERNNYIVRRSSNLSKYSQIIASNIDLVVLIVTIKHPETSTVFIDRFLATAEAYQVPACIVINKIDLCDQFDMDYIDALKILYESIGYKVFPISVLAPHTMADLTLFLKDKVSLISGNSGVGKSSIINQLIPDSAARVGEISNYHKKGMHTTTFSEMFDLPSGGALIDTPGIKGFGTIDMDYYEVGHYFKEIFEFSKKCHFNNCTHIHEPGCAVMKALEDNYISESRYKSYLSILDDCKNEKYR